MKQLSSQVRSSQDSVHNRLVEVVTRHQASEWQQPLHPPTVTAFEQLLNLQAIGSSRDLMIDSGCGTGYSTRLIASAFPEALVIGIDRSDHRLARLGHDGLPHIEGNAIWIQAELETFWRLASAQGWNLSHHYLLYPNPWPKPGQLLRRWHAHPVFRDMLALGGSLEMRSNWKIYAEEFCVALKVILGEGAGIRLEGGEGPQPWPPVSTRFENKYGQSGHTLYRVTIDLEPFRQGLIHDHIKQN